MSVPFDSRPADAGQVVLIIAPSGHGKNILLRALLAEHLHSQYILLVSDSAAEAVDSNDQWYNGPITKTQNLQALMEKLLAARLTEPLVLVIDDPAMDQKTVTYLSNITRRIRHTKITVFILFQKYTREISPDIRHNARLLYFSSKCGRALLETIYDSLTLKETKGDFIAGVQRAAELYRFIFSNKETGELSHFKPSLEKAQTFTYKLNPARKLACSTRHR
jgi:hypothetical protein